MRNIILFFCFSVVLINATHARNDTIFFYYNGEVTYKRQTSLIDSITFVPINNYQLKVSESVYNKIKSYPELSIFSTILRKTGYDKMLYGCTIWAPANTSLIDLDFEDIKSLRTLVENHISKGIVGRNYESKYVRMINNKKYDYQFSKERILIEKNIVLKPNIEVGNCIVNIIGEKIPYKLNAWEYLNQPILNDGFDTYRIFFKSFKDKSEDSLFVNHVYSKNKLTNEFNEFTLIIPENKTCDSAFKMLLPNYNVYNSLRGLDEQVENTKWVLIRNQIFDQLIPLHEQTKYRTSFGQLMDYTSIVNYSINQMELSNGRIFFVNHLKQFDYIKQRESIKIEAENQDLIKNTNSTLEVVKKINDSIISGSEYLKVTSTSNTNISKVSLTMPIINLIPGNYKIYAVIIPDNYENSSDLRDNKLNFYISYIDKNGVVKLNEVLKKDVAIKSQTPVKVELSNNFHIPFVSSINNFQNSVIENVKIENAALVSENAIFKRSFCIDCIIFEPI